MVFLPLGTLYQIIPESSQICGRNFAEASSRSKLCFSLLSLSLFFSLFYFIIHGGEPWKIFDDNARSMAGERRARIDSLVNGNVAWITARPLSSIFYVTRASI